MAEQSIKIPQQLTQPVQQEPIEPKKKSGLPAIGILLIVILLIGAGSVYVGMQIGKRRIRLWVEPPLTEPPFIVATPQPAEMLTPDETGSWETYEGFGYSIKYPRKEAFDVVRKNDSWEELTYYFDVSKKTERIFSLSVSREKTNRENVSGLCEGRMMCEYGKFNSYDLVRSLSDTVPPDFCLNYMLVNEGYLYTLTLRATKCNVATFQQILSTFKFTDQKETKFTCPQNGWVDCMPIMDEAKILACSKEAEEWYKANCPNFKGFAQ